MKLFAIIAASLWMFSAAASAQTAWTPSTDELIKQLKPSAGGQTRGIVSPHSSFAPVGAPAPETVASVRPQPSRTSSVLPRSHAPAQPPTDPQGTANLTVQFENNSDRLTHGATHILDVLGRALSNADLSGYTFRIVGHTDAVGRSDYNQALSERRASAVAAYLSSHFKVDASRLTTMGKGQEEPLVPTAEGVAEPRNRRVQIINTGA